MTNHDTTYYRYTENELAHFDSVAYIDRIIDGLSLIDGKIERLTPRSFRVSYIGDANDTFCHFDVFQRASNGHFSMKIILALNDGTLSGTVRYTDITCDSFIMKMTNVFNVVRASRSQALAELPAFSDTIIDGLTQNGYMCLGHSPTFFAFKGKHMTISISISQLGRFKAILMVNRKIDGAKRCFETEGIVSKDNAINLCNRIQKLV